MEAIAEWYYGQLTAWQQILVIVIIAPFWMTFALICAALTDRFNPILRD